MDMFKIEPVFINVHQDYLLMRSLEHVWRFAQQHHLFIITIPQLINV